MFKFKEVVESMNKMLEYERTGEKSRYDLTEFAKFVGYMQINHELKLDTINDGVQAICYRDGERIWDVVIHCGSYGHEEGLLEGYMGPFVSKSDEVTGWLTAFEAIELVEKWEEK